MGFMDKILGAEGRTVEDYVELDVGDIDDGTASKFEVHIAEIGNQQDVIAIKDAVYDGDMVVADITRLRTSDTTMERVTDELRQVAREVGGDIVQKDDDQLLITPSGIKISRQRLGE